jgi:hypothetical protein
MPYLVSSIIAVVSAMIIMLTRYEADDSTITAELDRMKSIFVTIDGFVNTYIESGGDLTKVNFEVLDEAGILLGNMTVSPISDDVATTGQNETKTSFPASRIVWQLIPVPSIDVDYGTSAGSAYKLLVDMRANTSLMSKAIFSESFSGREFCEKMLFGTKELNRISYDSATKNFIGASTNKSDGLFVCIVFK